MKKKLSVDDIERVKSSQLFFMMIKTSLIHSKFKYIYKLTYICSNTYCIS